MPVRPNTLKVIQSFVLKLRHATSLATAEVTNIATQSQLMARHPCAVSVIVCQYGANRLRFKPPDSNQCSKQQSNNSWLFDKRLIIKNSVSPAKTPKPNGQPRPSLKSSDQNTNSKPATTASPRPTFTLNIGRCKCRCPEKQDNRPKSNSILRPLWSC